MKNKQELEQRFKLLLRKFQEDECSPLELNEFQKLINEEPLSSEIKDTMFQELDHQQYPEHAAFNGNQIFRNLELQLDAKLPKPKHYRLPFIVRTISVAALIVLLMVVSGLTAYFFNQRTAIHKLLSVSYCEVVSPLEANSQVILPDSTVVWLNAGSKLTYSSNYNIDNRMVWLEGEAYFEVAKNNKQDFVVDAFGFLVEGDETEFNVKAYRNEPTIEAVLVEGKVWIHHRTDPIASEVSLSRKFKATFYKQSEQMVLDPGQPRLVISPNVDTQPLISWKDGRFIDQNSKAIDHSRILGGQELVMHHVLKNRKPDFADPFKGSHYIN